MLQNQYKWYVWWTAYQSLNIGNDVQINSKDVCVTATCKHSKDIYMHKQLVTNASLCNLKHTAGTGPHVGTWNGFVSIFCVKQ